MPVQAVYDETPSCYTFYSFALSPCPCSKTAPGEEVPVAEEKPGKAVRTARPGFWVGRAVVINAGDQPIERKIWGRDLEAILNSLKAHNSIIINLVRDTVE